MTRLGGVSAILCGATYVFGFVVLLALLEPAGFGVGEAEAALSVVAENRAVVRLWYFVIYIVNAVFLAVLAVALAEEFRKSGEVGLSRLSLTTGTIWATLVLAAGMVMNVGLSRVLPLHDAGNASAVLLWQVTELVENGLGGGNEIAGGVWALVNGFAALRSGALPRGLPQFSLLIGTAGLLTIVPALGEIGGAVFGLGYILWFFWVGIGLLLRGESADKST